MTVAGSLPLAAQTASGSAAGASRMHSRVASHSAGGCAVPAPMLPAKIPALPPGTPCVKALYTVTRLPETKLDYVSPLVSEPVRDSLGSAPLTFSLEYAEIRQGAGEPVALHKFLTVRYTGYLASDGTKFDSSEDHPNKEPITFQYGEHRVIPGWDTGFEGMRVGGKRRLYIPWELAYGETGRPPVIPRQAELIFDVEVVGVSDQPPTPVHPPFPPAARPGMSKPGAPGAPPSGAPGATPPATSAKPQATQGSAQPH